jgi:molecular chaperone DnaK
LGGGTFDVSVLKCVGGEYQVLAIDGDNFLGGDDFDRRFAEWLRKDMEARGYALALDVQESAEDRARFVRLVHLAQEIKESLSTSEVVHVSKDRVLTDTNGEEVSYEAEIGRAQYEAAVKSLVDTTLECTERALARSREVAGVGIEHIDHVVLVGGSTRVPLVVRAVSESICKRSKAEKPLQEEVDTCVALGAAIYAAMLGGLKLGVVEKDVAVQFRGSLTGRTDKVRVSLSLVGRPPWLHYASIEKDGQDVASLSLSEPALRVELPLGSEPETDYAVVLRGTDNVHIPFAVYRSDDRPKASLLSRPTVVPKDIAIEVVRSGRRDKKLLLERGEGLPAKASHRFFTGDSSGAVVLRLLQNRLPIKTMAIEVPEGTPVGTPVELVLTCDESMRMEARATVLGKELWAQLTAPELSAFEKKDAIDRLLAEAEAAGRDLWGRFADAYRNDADRLIAQIRESVGIDPDKTNALCQSLRTLIDEWRGGASADLVPPMHVLEGTLDAIRRRVYRTETPLLGLDKDAWENRLHELAQRGTRAFDESDAPTWKRVCNEAQALYESVSAQEADLMDRDDAQYLANMLANTRALAEDVELRLTEAPLSSQPEVRAVQDKEVQRLVLWLGKIDKSIAGLSIDTDDKASFRRAVNDAYAELKRIETAITRLPNMGLPTDRG